LACSVRAGSVEKEARPRAHQGEMVLRHRAKFQPSLTRHTRIGSAMFFSACGPMSSKATSSLPRTRQLRRLLGVDPAVAESAVKISAVLGFDNFETSGNAVRSHRYRPRCFILQNRANAAVM